MIPSYYLRVFLSQAFCKYQYVYILLCHFALIGDKAMIGTRNMDYYPPVVLALTFVLMKFVAPKVAKLIDPEFGQTTPNGVDKDEKKTQ